MVDQAVADDAGTDDDDLRLRWDGGHQDLHFHGVLVALGLVVVDVD
jgi:hypothetical protein